MLGTILVVILILILIGGIAPGPWAGTAGPYWGSGYYGGGAIGTILIVVLILLLLGRA